MKILVAGASGVIGRALIPLLSDAGHEVIALSRRSSPSDAARWRIADVYDRPALNAIFAEVRPDAVMHQLTDLSGQDFAANRRIRIEGTRNLVDAARAVGVGRMVAQSIAWAYVPGEGAAMESMPLDLDAEPPRKSSMEGVAGLETAVAEMPHGVVLRYGTLYGPGTWFARDGSYAKQVLRGEVKASSAVTNFLHVEDAARAAVSALNWPAGPVNLVDDTPAASTDWLPDYARELGAAEPGVMDTPGPAWARPVSNAHARSLGWEPLYSSWREGFFKHS